MEYVKTIFVILCLLLLGAYSVFGQEHEAVTLTPATLEIEGNPGETLTHTFTITNAGDTLREYVVYTKVIDGVIQDGVPKFTGDSGEHIQEITDWLVVPQGTISVAAGSTTAFTITLQIPESIPPGGYFGGLIISPSATAGTTTEPLYEIASIINLEVLGEVIHDVRIRSFSTDRLLYGKKDVVFTLEIENQGTVLVRPYGPITITNIFGTQPETVIMNEGRAGIFPGTTRSLDYHWSSEGMIFGKYEAVAALIYETQNGQETVDARLVFWVFPLKIVIPLMVVIAGIVLFGYIFTQRLAHQAAIRGFNERRLHSTTNRKRVGMSKSTFVTLLIFCLVCICIFSVLMLKE